MKQSQKSLRKLNRPSFLVVSKVANYHRGVFPFIPRRGRTSPRWGRHFVVVLVSQHSWLSMKKKYPEKTANIWRFPSKWRLRNERRNSILVTRHYPDLGRACDWLNQISHAAPLEALPRRVNSKEFLCFFLRRHLSGKPAVALPNIGCFLRLSQKEKQNKTKQKISSHLQIV